MLVSLCAETVRPVIEGRKIWICHEAESSIFNLVLLLCNFCCMKVLFATTKLKYDIFFFFPHTFTFQLLHKSCSQVSSLFPPGSCLQFLSRIGFSDPIARRFFIECC